MTLSNRLQTLSAGAIDRARKAGLPVAQAEQLYSAHLQPRLLRTLSRFAIPFVRRSGVRVLALEPGRVVCRMPLKGNVNHIGTMYAGALFTLAEFPGGPLMLATYGLTRFIPIVTSLDLAFVKAAKTDVTVEFTLPDDEARRIEAETLERGQADFVLEGALRDARGETVATSLARYQMRPRRR